MDIDGFFPDIAVIGYAGRFPRAKNTHQYWENLRQGINCISEVGPSRWDPKIYYDSQIPSPGHTYSKWGGFIDGIELFDPLFFNIPPGEAKLMDPQQRLFLQVVWETLEHAGCTREKLSGSNTGVFVGVSASHYKNISVDITQNRINGLSNSRALIANRVSHFMNFNGPSAAVDSQCTSSLVALHQACRSICLGECQLAIAGGVNLLPDVNHFITLSQMKILSPNNKSRVFDRTCNGFILGECVGALLLKPLDRARAENDSIHAVIKASAVSSSGNTKNILISDYHAMAMTIKKSLENARIEPQTISYIESGATGTPLGDVTEIKALAEAYRPFLKKGICPIGSVVPNIGNSEAGSGIAAVIKAILVLTHREIPPVLYFERENPLIKFAHTPFFVNTRLRQLTSKNNEPLRIGINSFGIGGTNAHLIMESPPEIAGEVGGQRLPYHILTLSAKSIKALKIRVMEFRDYLIQNKNDSLEEICFTANTGRDHFTYRIAYIAESKIQLIKKLEQTNIEDFPGFHIEPYSMYYKKYTREKKPGNSLKNLLASTGIDRPVNRGTTCAKDSHRLNPSSQFKDIRPLKTIKNHKEILQLLDKLGKIYCERDCINWNKLYEGLSLRKKTLPFYPFENKKCWFNKKTRIENSKEVKAPAVENKYYIESGSNQQDIANNISDIFVEKLASELDFERTAIDLDKDFTHYGFDSIFVTSLIKCYEGVLGIVIPPSLFFSHHNMKELSVFLAQKYLNQKKGHVKTAPEMFPDSSVTIISASHKHFQYVNRWLEDPDISQWLDPFFQENFTIKEFAYFLRKRDKVTFIINYLDKPVGICGLVDINLNNESAEGWLAIGQSRLRSKGVALHAGDLLLKYAFDEMNLNTIQLKMREDNAPAIAMAEFSGFRRVGILYESLKYKNKYFNAYIYQMTRGKFEDRCKKRMFK